MYQRSMLGKLHTRMAEPRRTIQVLCGPRQSGKTTIAQQLMELVDIPCHYASADEPTLRNRTWIGQQWEQARTGIAPTEGAGNKAILILDEIQKVPGWSETVKRLWDEDSLNGTELYVIILGSSSILVHRGMTESLAGRFETIHVPHWSYDEMRTAFNWSLEQYIFFGGYPGTADMISDHERWCNYIKESLVEVAIARDVLLMSRITKPALLRQLFELGCRYSGQILTYQKMLGQLHDAGNTTTLAHYLELIEKAGLLAGLPKYSGSVVRRRASSPKLQVLNQALLTTQLDMVFEEALKNKDTWGRLVESAAGAHLYNGLMGTRSKVYYWRERDLEVDFILSRGESIAAIEVASGARKTSLPGMVTFAERFQVKKKLLAGAGGMPLEEFFLTPPKTWLD